MTTTHTPGPWALINGCIWPQGYDITDAIGLDHEPNPADLRLIAAAPDLLNALRAVEDRLTRAARAFYGDGSPKKLRAALDGWRADIEPARAAITKAEGGAA